MAHWLRVCVERSSLTDTDCRFVWRGLHSPAREHATAPHAEWAAMAGMQPEVRQACAAAPLCACPVRCLQACAPSPLKLPCARPVRLCTSPPEIAMCSPCAGLRWSQDSAYEYMLKQWVMSGRKDEVSRVRKCWWLASFLQVWIRRSSPSRAQCVHMHARAFPAGVLDLLLAFSPAAGFLCLPMACSTC
eukprot:365305-Chlamydomonas_euryale.AAC.3